MDESEEIIDIVRKSPNESWEPGPPNEEQWESVGIHELPKWPKVIGIISICWGALSLTCTGLMSVWAFLVPKLIDDRALEGAPMPEAFTLNTTDWMVIGISLSLIIVLIFAGITCVGRRPITRVLHLVYAGVSVPLTVWSYINQTAKQATLAEWIETYPDSPLAEQMQSQGQQAGQAVGLILTIVLGFGIPLFYLIWFGVIKTKPEQITGGDEGVY